MERYVLDRFEEDFAVLEKEEGGTFDVKKSLLPDAKAGDVIIEENGRYLVDKMASLERKEAIAEKRKRLFERK